MPISATQAVRSIPLSTDWVTFNTRDRAAIPSTATLNARTQQASGGVIAWLGSTFPARAAYSVYDFILPKNAVTGARQFLALIPVSWEVALGKFVQKTMVLRTGECYNPAMVGMADKIVKKIAAVADRKFDYQVKVLDTGVLNAACAPGGYMVFNRGLMEGIEHETDDFGLGKISKEAKVAAIMAHEIVHAAARHGVRGIEFGILISGLVLLIAKVAEAALMAIGSKQRDDSDRRTAETAAYVVNWMYENIGDLITTLWRASFSRENEDESDRYGMVYLKRAGYDPKAMIWAMEYLNKKVEHEHFIPWLNHVTDWFRTHDHAKNRANKCRETLRLIESGQLS